MSDIDEKDAKPVVYGYTAGVFDLFHVGHLNILRNAKSMCDHLIVGVTSDELVKKKKEKAIIPFRERADIVQSIEYVDTVVGQYDTDKFKAWQKLKFDKIFVGDDWFGSPLWKDYEKKFEEVGVEVVYFPYSSGTSSTMITDILNNSHRLLLQAEQEEAASSGKTTIK